MHAKLGRPTPLPGLTFDTAATGSIQYTAAWPSVGVALAQPRRQVGVSHILVSHQVHHECVGWNQL